MSNIKLEAVMENNSDKGKLFILLRYHSHLERVFPKRPWNRKE